MPQKRTYHLTRSWVALAMGLLLSAAQTSAEQQPQEQELDHRPPPATSPELLLTNLAFGSCCKQHRPQPIWQSVVAREPELFLWLGDNVYGDSEDPKVLAQKYHQLAQVPGYQKLVAHCPVIATWDDHDYGKNDAGREFPIKAESKEIMLNFFDEPETSPRREREGIYTSYLLGPEGQRTQIILLDCRTFRSPLKKGAKPPYYPMGRYQPDRSEEATMLGAEQWKWLAAELQKPAQLRLICSGTQLLNADDGFEQWANFPRELERLFDLIRQHQIEGVVFLTGDSHHGELHLREEQGIYPLWELTSSGINQGLKASENQTRVGPAVEEPNAGEVTINWEQKQLTLKLYGQKGRCKLAHTLPFSRLTFAPENLTPSTTIADAQGTWQTRYGPLTLTQNQDGSWKAQGKGNTIKLAQKGKDQLQGTWKYRDKSGPCTFTLSRDGSFLRGLRGVHDGPLLINWNGWKPTAEGTTE